MPQIGNGARMNSRTIEGYKQMMEETARGVTQMETHMREMVRATKMSQARIYEDEHRIIMAEQTTVPLSTGVEIPCLQFTVVQGEAWKAERMSFATTDNTVLAFFCYRDAILPSRLAEVAVGYTAVGGSAYSDSFSNRLYLPPRTTLYVVPATAGGNYSATAFDGSIQVEVLKRVQHPITQEEAYVRAGELTAYERAHDERWDDADQEPHDERHGTGSLEDEGYGGDIEPPSTIPEKPLRPEPHFPQKVEQAIEHVLEDVL